MPPMSFPLPAAPLNYKNFILCITDNCILLFLNRPDNVFKLYVAVCFQVPVSESHHQSLHRSQIHRPSSLYGSCTAISLRFPRTSDLPEPRKTPLLCQSHRTEHLPALSNHKSAESCQPPRQNSRFRCRKFPVHHLHRSENLLFRKRRIEHLLIT